MHPELGCTHHQGMGHVVAVADEGDLQAGQLALVLQHGLVIRHSLAGMGPVGEGIDDGNGRILRQVSQGDMGKGTDHDAVQITGQHLRRIGNGFTPSDLQIIAA
ncbi:hypothetical protein D3C75_1098980 [compost metagenome]